MKRSLVSHGQVAVLAIAMAASAAPVLAAQSSAYAVSADLTTDGSSHVQLAPQLQTSGAISLGQTYDNPQSSPLLGKIVRLLPLRLRGPALTVLEQKLLTDASGISGIDAVNTQGLSRAAAGEVALSLYPPVIIDPPPPASGASATDALIGPVSALRVQFSKLKATANYDHLFPGDAKRSGSTSFGSVTLSGPLIGAKPLTFSGEIKPDTVVVQTPTLKITLNAQVIPQNPVCTPGTVCPMYRVLETVETKAVLIELTDAAVLGHKVSGNIVIGDAQAGE
jgi:hypothetical protein